MIYDYRTIVRRFVIGWLLALAGLCVIAVVKHWGLFVELISRDVTSMITHGIVAGLMIYIVAAMFRTLVS